MALANKLKTKNGRITRYAFYCGYTEEKTIDDNNRITMSLEPNGFHIKGFKNGKHVWCILENGTYHLFPLVEARRAFDMFFEHDYLIYPFENFGNIMLGERLKKRRIYKAILATNQPNYEEQGLMFVGELLLSSDDYGKVNF